MINDANKKQILDSFIANIACMADEEYQNRIWILAEGPECDDIDDTICDFFDEDYILRNHKDFGIMESQYNLLMKLSNVLTKFKDTYEIYSYVKSTKELIKLPEWEEIRNVAKKVLQSFNHKL